MARKAKKTVLTQEERLRAALVPEGEQPYPVPENWCWVHSLALLYIEYGKGLSKKQLVKEGYPVFGANGQIGFFSQYMFEQPKALMSCRGAYSGTMNKSLPFSFITSNSLIIQGKTLKFSADYLCMLFSALDITPLVTGTAQPQVTVQSFEKYFIPLPPLPEQQRIVARIESLFAKLDEAKEKVQAALDSFEPRKAAVLHRAFSGELTEGWRKTNKVAIESWKTNTIKECCTMGSGGTPSRKHSEYYNGTIPWVKTGEIFWNRIYDSEEKISENAIENSSAKVYPVGTVVVAMYGQGLTRGRAAILEVEATTNQAVCALQPNNNLTASYLYYYFMANYWNYRERAIGGNQPNYSATMIGKWVISIPSLDEQNEIVRLLDALFEQEAQAKAQAEAALEAIDTMKKSILARAFRGELGTNDPAEESAVELLKQSLDTDR